MTTQVQSPVVLVSQSELRDRLLEIAAATFAAITYETEPAIKSPKTSGMQGRILKVSTINPIVGNRIDYRSIVNRRLDKVGEEPVVEVQPRKWGVRIGGTPFVEHKGNLYLECLCGRTVSTQYFLDGNPVDKADISQYLLPKKESDLYGLGEDKPIWRDIRLDHIRQIVVDHTTYRVN